METNGNQKEEKNHLKTHSKALAAVLVCAFSLNFENDAHVLVCAPKHTHTDEQLFFLYLLMLLLLVGKSSFVGRFDMFSLLLFAHFCANSC